MPLEASAEFRASPTIMKIVAATNAALGFEPSPPIARPLVIADLGDQNSEDDMKALYLIAPVFAMVANPVSAQVSRAERSAEPAVFSMAGPCDCSTNSDTRQVTASLSQEEGEEILQRLAKVSPASITTHGQLAEVIGNEKLLMAAAGDAEIELDKDEPRRKIDWKKVLRIVVIVLDAILNP